MTQRFTNMILVAIAAFTLVNNLRSVAAERYADGVGTPIVLRMNADVTIDTDIVRISDVCQVQCSDTQLRRYIESVDLDDAPQADMSTRITPENVEFRLHLAGVDPQRITIVGHSLNVTSRGSNRYRAPVTADRVVLASNEHSPVPTPPFSARPAEKKQGSRSYEDLVVCAAKQCVLERLPWREEDIEIRLAHGLGREVRAAETAHDANVTAELKSIGPPVGRVQVEVHTKEKDGTSSRIPVAFDVRHFDNVVATTRPVARGTPLTAEDLYLHRSDVTALTDYCSDCKRLIGTSPRRALPALQIVRTIDLDTQTNSPQSNVQPIVVKPQERVTITAVIGGFSIESAGVAQQNGRLGDTIRVQNLDSKRVVEGRVIGPNEVRVAY